MRFAIKTFGCKTNQYETQAIRESLRQNGHCETAAKSADYLIVNTCAVTGRAESAWRNFIAQVRRENPEIKLILAGCAVTLAPEIASRFNAVKVFSNAEKISLADFFKSEISAPSSITSADSASPTKFVAIKNFAEHSRAFVKIQDGCDNSCAYCVIPRARGGGRSRAAEEIVAEISQLISNGYREIALTGINIGAYRSGEITLAKLCRKIADESDLARLRLGSIEPQLLDDDLLFTIRDYPQICRHLHLPLQSGDDRLLRLCNRRYTFAEFSERVARARQLLDTPAITTDLIVGLPTEDDEAFAANVRALKEIAFARAHIFLFSPRPETPLAKIPRSNFRQLDAFKTELTTIAAQTAAEFARSLIGKNENVLVEKIAEDSFPNGYGERYLRIEISAPSNRKISAGEIIPVKIISAHENKLRGQICAE